MNDFYNKPEEPKTEEKPEEKTPEVFKVGDQEYSREELESLVADGKYKRDIETRHNTKLDRVVPEFTKATQQRAELQKRIDEITRENLNKKPVDQLSPEEIKQRAITEADELGLIHKGNIRQEVMNIIQGQELIDSIDYMMKDAKKSGKPTMETADFLRYMSESGYQNPSVAYKEKFLNELSKWEKEQINKIKEDKGGFSTINKSTAGAKQPDKPKQINSKNLNSFIRESLYQGLERR